LQSAGLAPDHPAGRWRKEPRLQFCDTAKANSAGWSPFINQPDKQGFGKALQITLLPGKRRKNFSAGKNYIATAIEPLL
jgi:hypothetical protein